jgi:hypothetical protein
MVQRNDSHHLRSNEPATKEEWWVVWRQDDNGNQFAVARFWALVQYDVAISN